MPTPPLLYRVQPTDLHAHLYTIQLSIAAPAQQQELALPVWIPGSYLVREFSKNLQGLQAVQANQTVECRQLDKHRWQLNCAAGQPIEVTYQVCAYDNSVRTAWLDQQRGFFNGTSLLLRAIGQEHQAQHLDILAPSQAAHWHLATGLTPVQVDAQGFGRYSAADYDELVDCPVEMGDFWSGSFTTCGVEHRFVVAGASAALDGQRLLRDTQAICETEIRFWHPQGQPPQTSYLFMLNATHNGYGGLEHRNSTALICNRADLPRLGVSQPTEGYTTLLGLISHEYFHTWNVKRLRPAEFAPYDYDRENYTELLWFFEGFTSYYDDLFLRRAGLIDSATYLKLVNKNLNQVLQTPGRQVQSLAQSSMDAWVKYYRQDENTPNATVSYYSKGALVALCLDLKLRHEGQTHLDAVMRGLWERCAGGAMTEGDVLAVLQSLSGRSWEAEIAAWVHGTADLPVAELLALHGVQVRQEHAAPAQALGLRVKEQHSILIKTVLRGGLAEQAGFMPGDEWYGVEVDGRGWRLESLENLRLYAGPAQQVTALVSRDHQLLRLNLRLAAADSLADGSTVKLSLADSLQADRWLGV